MSPNTFITLGVFISSLVFSTSHAQCPPIPEGSLPQQEKITHLILPTTKVFQPAERVSTKLLKPVNLTKKRLVNSDAVVLSTSVNLKQTIKEKVFINGNVGFPGPVSIQVPGAGSGSKIIEQDGRIIIVGGSDTFNDEVVEQGIYIARFNADGTPDPSFGQGGSSRIILFAQNRMANNSTPSIALSPNGQIVIARTITDLFPGNIPGTRVAVVRMDHDGSLDPTFGNGGLVFTTIDNHFEAKSVAVQRDNKVIVGGQSGHYGTSSGTPFPPLATLVRYQTNGMLDFSFGGFGVTRAVLFVGEVTPVLSRESSFSSILIQENGLIVAAGTIQQGTGEFGDNFEMLIAEYLPTGELNPVFASSGATMLTFEGPYQRFDASSLAIRENGRILAGGSANLYAGNSSGSSLVDQAFVFAQLTPGGELDDKFGSAGKVVVNINPLGDTSSPSRPLDQLTKVMLDSNGGIYAAGLAFGPVGNSERAIDFVALHSNGSLKKDFGNSGTYSFGTFSPWKIWLAQDALLTSDGRLVISGTHWNEHLPDGFVLWAYSTQPGSTGCPLTPISTRIQ